MFNALDPALLAGADMAIATGMKFPAIHFCLALLEFRHFAIVERAAPDASPDTLLLVDIAPHVSLHAPAGGGIGIAGLRIMLFSVNIAAGLVLHALDAALLGIGDDPVF